MIKLRIFQPLQLLLLLATACIVAPSAVAHCQVPCGIYDDHMRLQAMLEDADTIRKATRQLAQLAGKQDPQAIQQATRWVLNKEQHAQRIIATISDYFLTQRIQPSQSDYAERLIQHHAVILAAMKTKQHAAPEYATVLSDKIAALAPYYAPRPH